MKADFKITVEEARKPMTVQVKIHDSVGALRMAANKYDARTGREVSTTRDLLGVCHRFHMANQDLVAIVRLAPPHIGAGMVTHELAHAAIWMWQIQNKFAHKPITPSEDEWFCLVLGELVRHTTNKLLEHGVYNHPNPTVI